MACDQHPGCDHPGFTHAELILHLVEKCPCGHTRVQHPDGGCRYCECMFFGISADDSIRFAGFLAWRAQDTPGAPPVRTMVRADPTPPPNPCPVCVREAKIQEASHE